MNAQEFLDQAREKISDDPRTRLTLLAKTMLDHPDCVVDIHTHIFDRKCLSVGYILLRMINSLALEALGLEAFEESTDQMMLLSKEEEEIYRDIEIRTSDAEADWEQLEKELERTIELNKTYELFGVDLKEVYRVIRYKNMLEVLDFYHSEFSITNLPEFSNNKMVTGILQMDLETGWGFSPKRKFKQQIEDIKEITKKRPILPYLAVDPRRAELMGKDHNLYELFLDAFTDPYTPFFGVKCYPALGYLPSDIRLDPIFQICAEKNIPVLTHCGGEMVTTFKKTIKIKHEGGYQDFAIPGDSRQERARYLNQPERWDPVLDKHHRLKLNFGHFGGGDHWQELETTGSNQRVEKIFSMMQNPDFRVYGDFSYSIIDQNLFSSFKAKLDAHPEIACKTLYGTDYWVVLPAGELLEMQKVFLSRLNQHRNAMLRDNAIAYLLN